MGASFSEIPDANDEIVEALKHSEFESAEDLTGVETSELKQVVNATLAAQADSDPLSAITILNSIMIDALKSEGVISYRELAQTDIDDLTDQNDVLSGFAGRLKKAKQTAKKQVTLLDEATADRIIQQAKLVIPSGPTIARENLQAWQYDGAGLGDIIDIEKQSPLKAKPVALSKDYTALDTTPEEDPTVQYVSSLGSNRDDPELTGFQVLDLDPDEYDQIPRPETAPNAGKITFPVDEDGKVIPPAIPDEPRLSKPLDELVAKKFARNQPVCLYGERGAGKNYLLKFLAWATNRGYRSIDCDKSTMPIDLFGPQTPNEEGIVINRDGPLKRGLLSPDIIALNEFSVLQAGAGMALHRLLNEGKVLIKHHGELVKPHDAACIGLTTNPATIDYPDSEESNAATKGRIRGLEQPYPSDMTAEVDSLDKQINSQHEFVSRDTIERVVDFAHRTRKDENDQWPTLSVRNAYVICENIADGAAVADAIEHQLWWMSRENQDITEAVGKISEVL